MQSRKSQRAGRKNNNERIRELVALLGSLSRTGDTVSLEAISQRLGLSMDDARAMMDIVCAARGEDIGGLLISSNEDETEYTLQFPGTRGRPVRLTTAETVALTHALDVAGIVDDDPLRIHLQDAFSSPEVEVEQVRHSLGFVNGAQDALLTCARSQVERRGIRFMYKGLRDDAPRQRRAVVRRLMTQGDHWYAIGLDLDAGQERTFRIDRMGDVGLSDDKTPAEVLGSENAQRVRITFKDKTYYTAFDWPGLRVLHETDDEIVCDIAYYGERSTWLLRRICAGKGSITVEDVCIMKRAQEYARATPIGTGMDHIS